MDETHLGTPARPMAVFHHFVKLLKYFFGLQLLPVSVHRHLVEVSLVSDDDMLTVSGVEKLIERHVRFAVSSKNVLVLHHVQRGFTLDLCRHRLEIDLRLLVSEQ